MSAPLLDAPLPRTIRDAIHLTQLLGEKYLWIDALCIKQDDAEFKTARILEMDQIYTASALTIIAARKKGSVFWCVQSCGI